MVEFDDISVDSDPKPESSLSKGRSKIKSTRGRGKKTSNKDSKRKGAKKSKAPKKAPKKGAKKAKKVMKYNPTESFMVPRHEIISEEEKEELAKKYGSLDYFPMILVTDPVAESIGAKKGDVIRIHREEGYYYRRVIDLRGS